MVSKIMYIHFHDLHLSFNAQSDIHKISCATSSFCLKIHFRSRLYTVPDIVGPVSMGLRVSVSVANNFVEAPFELTFTPLFLMDTIPFTVFLVPNR